MSSPIHPRIYHTAALFSTDIKEVMVKAKAFAEMLLFQGGEDMNKMKHAPVAPVYKPTKARVGK